MANCGLRNVLPDEIKDACKHYGDGYCYADDCSWKEIN